ncbi:MAG: hypothetical protein GXO93_08165 [FCB group bacterium]|nr:hypothetical protein [FCB group bacterium]
MVKKIIIVTIFIISAFAIITEAQETYFGKNKVRYKDFKWDYIQTRHFDIYFYEKAYPKAKFAATVLESAYVEISHQLNYRIQKRVPIFIYNSHNDFQQTNIISSLIPESVGGFTEVFKNRIVIPFDGSYEDFRHVLHHELTHAVVYDMLYGSMFASLLSRQRLFHLPLWYAEGYAEYSSRHGWDYQADMFVRDATINNYLTPPRYLNGFLAYKEGQALIKFIADKYGQQKLGEILKKGKVYLTINKALKEAIGIDEKKLWEEFSKEMKRRYWPAIAERKEPDEFAKQLTHARKDGSYFNEKPAFSPNGDEIAIFTDKSDYTSIELISANSGKTIRKIVNSQRSGDLESLHSFVSGMSFSPDGRELVFVAKSGGKESLFFYNFDKHKIYKKIRFNFYNIISPAWSPDGKKIAFAALKGNDRDIFIYHLKNKQIDQLTNDHYDDKDPSWLPNSDELIFSSDRPHPGIVIDTGQNNFYTDVSKEAYHPDGFQYGYYNLFRMKLASDSVTPLNVGPGQNTTPAVSPDGKKVAFLSNRNGIDNIYIGYLDSVKYYAATDILSGIRSLSWSPDGKKIAFSAFNKGAFDIFVMKDIAPVGDSGVLTATDFIKGKYDLLKKKKSKEQLSKQNRQKENKANGNFLKNDYITYKVDTSQTATASDSTSSDTTVVDTTQQTKQKKDSSITTTGIYNGEYVFVSKQSNNPFDSMFVDMPFDSNSSSPGYMMKEPASFDSIPKPSPSGDYKIHKYKIKFTPDYISGGFTYDTFFGLRGQSYFVFTDYLGNNQIYIATDLVNTIDQSNIQLFYLYTKKRANIGFGAFHTKNFYVDSYNFLFSDRFYGFQMYLSYPFSTFNRIELNTSQYFIDRQYYDYDDPRIDHSSKITTGEFSYVTDNVIWGYMGPVNGRRAKLSLSGGANLFDPGDIDFTAAEFDYRKYWHIKKTFSFALRFSGGASFGATPKLYFLGGTTNWIGSRTLNESVYSVENLYFSDVVTPLRGVPYYELSGDRYGLINAEFRFPLIEYFIMRFPLPIAISGVEGAVFTDVGSAWYGSHFKGGTTQGGHDRLQDIKVGFGFGARMNLGIFLLRYDLAWSTDMNSIAARTTSYFSFGADF